MPRRARPWFRKERARWFVQIQGKQHPLPVTDPTDAAGAAEAYRKLVDDLAAVVAGKVDTFRTLFGHTSDTLTVSSAVVAFLAAAEKKVALGKLDARACGNYRTHLAHVVGAFGGRPIGEVSAEEFELWADRPAWSSSYQNGILGTVISVLKFAKVVLDPPIRKPPKESAGPDSVLSDEQFETVLAAMKRYKNSRGDLVELLRVIRETGARPGEIARLTVETIDWGNSQVRHQKHKTKRKTGRYRLIVFPEAAMKILEVQRVRYGSGVLFRTRAGQAYAPNVIVKRMITASERAGIHATAYGAGRHSFGTKALINGIPEPVVAALLGHTSTAMVNKHYGHVGSATRTLRDAAERVSRAAG